MSQVRKLLQGNVVPKAENGYQLIFDKVPYNVTDEQLNKLNQRFSEEIKDPLIKQELVNWVSGIKTGKGVIDAIGNTVSENMLPDNYKRGDKNRLSKKKATDSEAIFQKRSWYAKRAISEGINMTRSILDESKPETNKTKIKNTTLDLDFNEKDGKKYLSPTAESNLSARKRISDVLTHLQAGDSSEYDYSEYNTDAISDWLNKQEGDDKYNAANMYFDNLWANMSKGDYKYDPDVEDLLKMFGINYNIETPNPIDVIKDNGGGDGVENKIGSIVVINDKNYKITGIDSNGKFIVEEIIENSENEDEDKEIEKPEESTEQNNNQIAQDLILVRPGEREDMDWGVIYKGVPYSYDSIQPGSELDNLMSQFEKNNRQSWSQGKRYNENSFIKMPSIENFSDWTVGQILDDGTDLNKFFLDQGITSAALSHIETDSEGNRYFKYYDNFNPFGTYIPKGSNTPKQNPWGIRSPYYLVIDKEGNIKAVTENYKSADSDYAIINSAPKLKDFWNPNSAVNENETVNRGYQGAFIPNTITSQSPATFIWSVTINGKKVNVYKLNDGRLYLDDPRYKVKEHKYVTPEELYNLIKTGKKSKFKYGGAVSKSKIKSFNNKFRNVIEAKEGISLSVKYPHYQRKYTENKPDGSVVGIIEEQDNLGNVTKKEVLLQSPVKQQTETIVKQEEPKAEVSNVETSTVYPKRKEQLVNLLSSFTSPNYELTSMPNVGTSDFVVPTVGSSKQKIIPIKTSNKRDFDDLVAVLENLSNNYEKGGVVKAQNGTSYNWTKEDDDWLQGYSDSIVNNTVSSIDTPTDIVNSKGGWWKQKPDLTKGLIPALSLLRFGVNAAYQNKYNRQAKKAIEAGRYHETPVTMNTPDINNPILDRALSQNNQERQIGVKQVGSDWVTQNALSNQRERQLWDREQSLIGQRSQFDSDIKKEVLNIQNQNILNHINTANSNRARDAAIDSAKLQQDMIHTQQRAQSFDNLGLEIQNNLMKDRQTMLNYNRSVLAQKLDDDYNREIDNIFSTEARNKYNSLSPDEAMKYMDYDDYLRRNYPNEYAKNKAHIDELQKNRMNDMNTWIYENTLNYRYPSFLLPRYKKGGRTNGTTRYTLDPDERIWVENNKAAHEAIAKLSDNTIKLLLRALK